jgi:broad specificity phosphatase PhoE
MLHLVRHASPRMDRSCPPWEWGLAPSARESADRLKDVGVLPGGAHWVSSSEPKAASTAALLTPTSIRLDDELREARRDPAFLDVEDFERLVLRSFADVEAPAADGWEPLAATRSRVVAAAAAAVTEAPGRDVVLVGHGTAMTMLVAALTGAGPDVPAWRAMRMPDHCALRWESVEPPPDQSPEAPPGQRAARAVPGALLVAEWGAWAP